MQSLMVTFRMPVRSVARQVQELFLGTVIKAAGFGLWYMYLKFYVIRDKTTKMLIEYLY